MAVVPLALAVLVAAGAGARSDQPPGMRLLLVTTAATSALGDAGPLVAGARDAATALGVELEVRRDVGSEALAALVAAPGDIAGLAVVDPIGPVDTPAGDGDVPIAILDRGSDTSHGDPTDRPGSPSALIVRADPARAGALAMERLADAGAQRVLCLIDESAMPVLETRCEGASAAAPAGVRVEILYALDPAGDPSGVAAAIGGRLAVEADIDAVLLARSGVEAAARRALDAIGDGRERRLAVIGPEPAGPAGARTADLGVDPRSRDQGWILVVGQVVAAQGHDRGAADPPARLEVAPRPWK